MIASDGRAMAAKSEEGAPECCFAHEDPNEPSHDFLLCAGSQILFEIRQQIFLELGYTTSAAVAPNPMLAKMVVLVLESFFVRPLTKSFISRIFPGLFGV